MSGGRLRARVEALLPGGEGLVHDGEGACLLTNVVPGDLVSYDILDRRRGVRRGAVTEIHQPGEQRVPAPCPVASSCGGCSLQFVSASHHAAIKSAWVHDAFRPAMDENTEWLPITSTPSEEFAPRRRLRWHASAGDDGRLQLGFKGRASDVVVTTPHCMVITPELEQLRLGLTALVPASALPGLQSVQAVQLSDGIHVVLETGEKLSAEFTARLPECALPVQWWLRDDEGMRPLSRPVVVLHDHLPTRESEIAAQIGPDDFVQGQAAGNESMIRQLLSWSEGAVRVVDLFAGVGNLSLPLAASGAVVTGAEVTAASVRAANANAKRLGVEAHYHQEDLFRPFDVAPYVGADLLIVDPPRKGAKQVVALMNRLLPKRVIMVHCDAASGGRDALAMREQGFRLQALRALDLFPWSGHVESLSLWRR